MSVVVYLPWPFILFDFWGVELLGVDSVCFFYLERDWSVYLFIFVFDIYL